MTLTCIRCKKTPEEITEYKSMAHIENMTPTEFVKENEPVGCWGKGPDKFYCTDCYVAAGMPLRRK